ncbi:MAG: hypothetical protein JO316_17945 [Abitibacteriaceae bacterium]|nr:hypothetical protein [Abditibacteriaceae bacterium]
MSKAIVRCRCGHQVLAKEVLRTDLYERSSGREYVYVKFRCRRCKRLGEAFVAENRWDWSILEPVRNDMTEAERDQFLDKAPISDVEVLEFHCDLREIERVSELSRSKAQPKEIESNANGRTGERNLEQRSTGAVDEPHSNRIRTSAEERRRPGAGEETHSEDSSASS